MKFICLVLAIIMFGCSEQRTKPKIYKVIDHNGKVYESLEVVSYGSGSMSFKDIYGNNLRFYGNFSVIEQND